MALENYLEQHKIIVKKTLEFINEEKKNGSFPIDKTNIGPEDVILFGNGLYTQASEIEDKIEAIRYGLNYNNLTAFLKSNYHQTSIYIPLNLEDNYKTFETLEKISTQEIYVLFLPIIKINTLISKTNARQCYMKFSE